MQVTTSVAFLQVLRWYFLLLVSWLYVVTIMQLEVSAAHMQVTVSAANMWMTIFIVIMQMGVCYNYAGGIFCSALCT